MKSHKIYLAFLKTSEMINFQNKTKRRCMNLLNKTMQNHAKPCISFKQPLFPRLFMHTPANTTRATRKTTDPAAIPAIIATFDGVVGGAVSTVMLNMTWRVFVSSFGFREEMMEKMYWPWSEWTTWNNVIICFKLKCIKALSPKPVRFTPAHP